MCVSKGFDFTRAMRALCHDVTQRLDEFRHVRIDEMAVTFAQARRRVPHGLQAKLTPMRFEDGSLITRRGGRTWTLERLYDGDREMLVGWIHRRPFRNRPRAQDAFHLESKIVVEAAGGVFLDDEGAAGGG